MAILLFSMAGCASQANRSGAAPIPDAGSADARLYASRCGACHALPHPRRLPYAGWKRLLPLMERRMTERGFPALSERERQQILRYLKAHAR